MTKLSTLRAQLAGLRNARALVRQGTAWSTFVTALLWALIGVFILDVIFEFGIPERIVLLLVAAGAVAWAGHVFTRPLLGVRETEVEIALMVERQQQIDSDLVAAIQFESPEAVSWGSPQLEGAVIDYVAGVGKGINVFEGFSREQMLRRGATLGITSAILLIAAAIFPGYALAFANRVLLGGMHYPTKTNIVHVLINRRVVLDSAEHGCRPESAKCAQGRPISFLILAAGELPKEGKVLLISTGPSRAKTEINVVPLTGDQRLARLKLGEDKLRLAANSPETDISQPWRDEILALVRFDAPQAVEAIDKSQDHASLIAAADQVAAAIKQWPENSSDRLAATALYEGQLDRLVDGVKYKLLLGDAWTDMSRINMIPLPIVQRRLTPVPPHYARTAQLTEPTSAPQISVLEGSDVQIAVECKNEKSLAAVWLVTKVDGKSKRFDLEKQDEAGRNWELKIASGSTNPFTKIAAETKYEIQATDTDGLNLETPLRGVIRIKPDRSPSGGAEIVHKVVLPAAEPVVSYRANDDFGIAQVNLFAEIEREQDESSPAASVSEEGADSSGVSQTPAPLAAAEKISLPLLPQGGPVTGTRLPLANKYKLNLGKLPLSKKLTKGDRVKLVLEVVDYRGNQAGASYYSDPLVLEISDESGVLAAISEADERSEQRLTDIIKRQLGIGESP